MKNNNNIQLKDGIEISNVTMRFKNFTALDSISLYIRHGEIFGLLGPNGAGKTTLLNIVCGLSQPTEGDVSIFGMNYQQHQNDIRKLIGFIPQETALYEHLTAAENLMFHARFYGVPASERKERVTRALGLAQLESRKNSKVKEFSGGMKRRLAIVRALLHDPRLLMLDEPSMGVDVQSRVEIWDKIKSMRGEKTIIITTNYMEEADYLCDRVAVLDQGKMIASGRIDELKETQLGEVIEISFNNPPPDFIENAPQIVSYISSNYWFEELAEKGDKWMKINLRVPDASSKITQVIDLLRKHGVETKEVAIREPSLNDVFIKLTGKRLRE
jgi:ABC-2 type transport system ATP-binding protein